MSQLLMGGYRGTKGSFHRYEFVRYFVDRKSSDEWRKALHQMLNEVKGTSTEESAQQSSRPSCSPLKAHQSVPSIDDLCSLFEAENNYEQDGGLMETEPTNAQSVQEKDDPGVGVPGDLLAMENSYFPASLESRDMLVSLASDAHTTISHQGFNAGTKGPVSTENGSLCHGPNGSTDVTPPSEAPPSDPPSVRQRIPSMDLLELMGVFE